MMQTISIEIPDDILAQYHSPEDMRRRIVEDFVAQEYQQGNISIRQGATMLGLTYEEFMVEFLGQRKISFINSTPEELALEAKQEAHWLDEVLGAQP